MKFAISGPGQVGPSNAVMLTQRDTVTALDMSANRVACASARKGPVVDPGIGSFRSTRVLDLTAVTDPERACGDADYVILFEPVLDDPHFSRSRAVDDPAAVEAEADLIVANRPTDDSRDVAEEVVTRDPFEAH